jgi:chemosensory pili system protein ChpA (sensor histidine kinase/response regulator)
MSFTYMGWVGGTRAFDPILARRAWLKVSEGATVLVVDDDAIVGEMYRLALTRSGFNALVAKDGPAGLQMAAASDPALIFLDIRMPRMDGIEVLEHLMADDKMRQIPVVMLSNYDDSTYIKRCMGLGAKEYVVKVSIRPAELATIASRWIKPPGA